MIIKLRKMNLIASDIGKPLISLILLKNYQTNFVTLPRIITGIPNETHKYINEFITCFFFVHHTQKVAWQMTNILIKSSA